MSTAPARWTESEKYSFLLQVLKQFGGEHAPEYKKINLTGRTEKAMSHQWSAIKKEMAAIGEDGSFAEGTGPKTPTKRGAGKIDGQTSAKKPKTTKKKAPVPVVKDEDEDEEQAEDGSS